MLCDLRDFETPGPGSEPTRAVRVVATGGLIERKQPLLVVESLALLESRTVELHWFGDGPLREALRERARELGVHVHLHGETDKSVVLEALTTMDVFFVPTRAETFFLGAAEALAAGLPVLTSDAGAHTEYLPTHASVVVKPDASPETWARALATLLEATAHLDPHEIADSVSAFSPEALAHNYAHQIERLLR